MRHNCFIVQISERAVRILGSCIEDEIEVTDTGYRRREVIIVPEEAAVVKEIFQLYADGLSMTDIARVLNHRKVPAPWSDCGWTIGRLRYMLRNERYCGDVLTRKQYTGDYLTHKAKRNYGEVTQYYIQDHHPAIITRELFQKVQSLMGDTHFTRNRNEYPFSGRLVCAHCGKKYHRHRNDNSVTWRCSGAKLNNGMRICDAEKLSQAAIDMMFLKAVEMRFPNHHDLLAQLETTQNIDFIERDKSIMRKQLCIMEDELDAAKNRLDELRGQVEIFKMRHEMFGEEFDEKEIITNISAQMDMIKQIETEKAGVQAELEEKERLWAQLEKDYDVRAELIHMLKTSDVKAIWLSLPHYVKALALSITVRDKNNFTVHWFDGTETEITMKKES